MQIKLTSTPDLASSLVIKPKRFAPGILLIGTTIFFLIFLCLLFSPLRSATIGLTAAGMLLFPVLLRGRQEAATLQRALAAERASMQDQQTEREESARNLAQMNQSLAQMNTLLADASGRFQELFQGLPVACVCYNPQGEIMEWNRAFEGLYGRSNLFGQSIWQTIYARAEAPQIAEAVAAVMSGNIREGVEWTYRREDGTATQLYSSIFPLRDAQGEITGTISADVNISAQHQAEEALRASEERLHALYNTTSQQELSFEAKMDLLLQRGGEQFGLGIGLLTRQTEAREEVVQAHSPENSIKPGDEYPLLATPGVEVTLSAPIRVSDKVWGKLCFAGTLSQSAPFATGDREMIRLMAQWIGGEIGRREAEEAVRESEEQFRSVVASLSEGLIVMDTEGVILVCNESAEQIFEMTRGEVQKWKPLNPSYAARREDGSPFPQGSYPLVVSLRSGRPQRNVVMGLPRPDGQLLWVSVNSNPLIRPNEDTPYAVVATFSDITERRRDEDKIAAQMAQIKTYTGFLESQKKQMEAANIQLEELAMCDGLTGLGNRRALTHRLELEMGRASRYSTPLSLIILDVDHFKEYNDTFGHLAGDEVLKHLALILKEQGRETDFYARYGGEEFAALLTHTDSAGANIVAERLRQSIETTLWPFRQVTASFGTSTLIPAMQNSMNLIAHADRALYAAKAAGRNQAFHALSLSADLTSVQPEIAEAQPH